MHCLISPIRKRETIMIISFIVYDQPFHVEIKENSKIVRVKAYKIAVYSFNKILSLRLLRVAVG